MQKIAALFFILSVLLAACAAPPADIPAASPGPSVEATRTRRPSQTPGPTKTLIPSHTPKPSSTITPTRPIPSVTPTFDARLILTATPEMRAECPKTSSAENANLDFLDLSFENSENRRFAEIF
jgi:hypothetical protein